MSALAWIASNWVLVAFLAVSGALGVQTYRLQGTQGELKLEVQARLERENRDAVRAAQNLKNKERTDEEYARALARARSVGVRSASAGISRSQGVELAASGNGSTFCVERGELELKLTAWARRSVERLAAVLDRHADRLDANAKSGEEVAAAYRSCAAYARGLATVPVPRPDHAPGIGVVGAMAELYL